MSRCLYCYGLLEESELDFHAHCSKKMFNQTTPPSLPYSETDLEPLAIEIIQSQTAVTGVQPKLSMHIADDVNNMQNSRFTIVGLWGGYILKPPTKNYPQLAEIEDLTMHLAEVTKIKTAPHSLIRLSSGSLAYITKRVDRSNNGKLAMEDFCQLTERLTEYKYQGSYEQVAKAINKHSSVPGLDVVNFFELVLFSFLTGNADMHLKNFSLLEQPGLGMVLSPAYDLVNTTLVYPADYEEMALNLNGKKRRLRKQDFVEAMTTLKLTEKQQENIFNKMIKLQQKWLEIIGISFLSLEFKEMYKQVIMKRFDQIY